MQTLLDIVTALLAAFNLAVAGFMLALLFV